VPTHLLIKSRRAGGHRRAGMRFGREPIAVALDGLPETDRAALAGDPDLIVEEGEIASEGDGLEEMTVTRLRALASEREVDLDGARRKEEIIERIRAAAEAAA
jgi:hypothetical protein